MIVLSWFFSSPWTEITAFDHFLEAMPEACNEILSNYVNSNGKSLGAIDLEISYNYKLFLEEYNQGGRKSEIALLKKICDIDQVSIPLTRWIQNELWNAESYIHWEFITIIVNTHLQRVILKHPVCESFLHMKWLLVKRIFDMYIFSYVIFLVSITTLVFIKYSPSFSGKIQSTTS